MTYPSVIDFEMFRLKTHGDRTGLIFCHPFDFVFLCFLNKNMKGSIAYCRLLQRVWFQLCKTGVSNSRPSKPFNAPRETILKFLMNFGSVATFQLR